MRNEFGLPEAGQWRIYGGSRGYVGPVRNIFQRGRQLSWSSPSQDRTRQETGNAGKVEVEMRLVVVLAA